MKKFTLGMLTLGSLLLAGCSSDETAEPANLEAKAYAVYAPSTGSIPIPNDLLFNGTQDLTLNLPVADPNDYSDPTNAISALDGWSTTAAFSFSFASEDSSASLDAATVVAGDTVRVFEVLADTDFNNPLNGVAPTFAPYQLIAEVPTSEYAVVPQGMSVAILPTKPLSPRSTYLVVATNGITVGGLETTVDTQYGIVKGQAPLAGSLAPLEPVRQLVNIYENLAAAGGVTKEDIVVSFAFTTQSVGTVMGSAKAFYVDLPISLFDPSGATPGLPQTPQYPESSFSSLFTNTTPFTGLGAANLYKGELTLDYLSETPDTNPLGPIQGFWTAADMVPNPENPLQMVPNPLAGGMLTYVNSLPGKNSDETVPLLVGVPRSDLGCAKPAEGYPVVIFQHGITRNRTDMLGVVDGLAGPDSCRVVIAMDLPLHGIAETDPVHQGLQAASGGAIGIFEGYAAGDARERTFGVDYQNNTTGAPGPDSVPDASGAHFINLPSLLTSRDNTRQGILDLLQLKSAIPAMDIDGDGNPDLNASEVDFIGHSLGAIIGSSFVSYADETTHFMYPDVPIVTSPQLDTATLAMPGGGIAGLLNASETFGPRIRAGIAAGAGLSTDDPAFPAVLQQFLFAAQTVVDSGDPINTAGYGVMNQIPTYIIRVEGDSVVPNNSPTAPLSGTDPLAFYLETQPIVAEAAGPVVGSRQLARFNTGLHGTILSPAGPNGATEFLSATTEMQTQVGSFIASDGAAVLVSDPSLLD